MNTLLMGFKMLYAVTRRVRMIALASTISLIIAPTLAAQTTDLQPNASTSDKTYSASSAAPQPSNAAHAAPQEEQYPTQSPEQGKLGVTMGPVNFRLYGTLLLNFSGSDNRVAGGDVPLWAVPGSGNVTFPDGSTGRVHDLFITARQTIVGFRISPSSTPASGWVPSATVEFDFFGARPTDPTLPQERVFDQPRLRVAYFELTKGTWRFVAGQDKVIIAPLDPISLSHVAIPLGATAGNLWGWLPQVRVEKTQALSEKTSLLFQGGVLRPEFGDPRLNDALTSSVSLDSSTAGTRSSMPFYEARIAISHPMNGSTATIGLGGHYGREIAGLTHKPDSWASALDFRIPLLSRVILRGESYVGTNLIPFQGGINQGVAVVAATSTQPFLINNIGDAGGWGELTFRATQDDKNHFYAGAGTDDPVHHDLLPGSGFVKNTFYWASYFRKLTNDVTMAMEWSNWQFRTESFNGNLPLPRSVGKANVFNLSFAYAF